MTTFSCRWMMIFLFFFVLPAVSGCSRIKPIKPLGSNVFDVKKAPDRMERETLEAAPTVEEEKPLVKIIKGTPVKSKEEAIELLQKESKPVLRGMQEMLHTLILRDITVRSIAEILTEICGYNVLAANSVADKKINIYLSEISLREAIEAICRLNDLWYREGEGIITLMSRDEYVRDIVVRQNEQTRAFYVRYTNAADMAKVIQAVMGEQVRLAAIEDENVYGHVDPEEEVDIEGEYKEPSLQGGSSDVEEHIPQKSVTDSLTRDVADAIKSIKTHTETTGGYSITSEKKPLLAILTVFKRNNCIIARSLDESLLNEMAKIIESLDTPTSQVLMEVKILLLTLDDDFESFFEIDHIVGDGSASGGDYIHKLSALTGGPAVSETTFDYVFHNKYVQARVAFFESQGRAEIISTPFLMSANNSTVEFFVGEETPLRDDVKTETFPIGEQGDTITTFNVEIKREELGTDVEMSTFINEDGTVTLEMEAEISTPVLNISTIKIVNEKTGQVLDFPLDGVNKSEIKSTMSVKSGQSVAIGGIIKETDDQSEVKVPLLGDIPGLGFFFKKKLDHKKKTETVIILTPHVISHPALAGKVSDDFLGNRSSHKHIVEEKENILSE